MAEFAKVGKEEENMALNSSDPLYPYKLLLDRLITHNCVEFWISHSGQNVQYKHMIKYSFPNFERNDGITQVIFDEKMKERIEIVEKSVKVLDEDGKVFASMVTGTLGIIVLIRVRKL